MRTLKDVLAVIQRIMKLDKRFLYARQLFLPDGELVTSYRALAAAASNDTPVLARSLRWRAVGWGAGLLGPGEALGPLWRAGGSSQRQSTPQAGRGSAGASASLGPSGRGSPGLRRWPSRTGRTGLGLELGLGVGLGLGLL